MAQSPSPKDLSPYFPATPSEARALEERSLSARVRGLVGSEILKIAAEIRAMQAAGSTVCNLTVGDFSPSEFRIPAALEANITEALVRGETNYPPSDGVLELRRAVVTLYERHLGARYPVESVVIAGGARPVIYATYEAVLDPGERVLYTVPSWNNNHYAFLARAQAVELKVGADTDFLPTAAAIRPLLAGVRLLCINSPLNPSGTVLAEGEVRAIAELVVEENQRRARAGERALFVMWDHVYWMLTFGQARHFLPSALVPESAPWIIYVDGISKGFAATGLRVGWSVAAPFVTARMRDLLGHMGAWAPRPEQIATARFLADAPAVEAYTGAMRSEVKARLDLLHHGFVAMAKDGLPVSSVEPQGAIYLATRFDIVGRAYGNEKLRSNEDVRNLLLTEAGFAVVPFQAFGLKDETGWTRLSVGAISEREIRDALPRVRKVLAAIA